MSKPVDNEQELLELLMTIRTTREVEHNDNQWTTEFVYSIEEAKARLLQWGIRQRIEEIAKSGLMGVGGLTPDQQQFFEERIDELQASLKDGGTK